MPFAERRSTIARSRHKQSSCALGSPAHVRLPFGEASPVFRVRNGRSVPRRPLPSSVTGTGMFPRSVPSYLLTRAVDQSHHATNVRSTLSAAATSSTVPSSASGANTSSSSATARASRRFGRRTVRMHGAAPGAADRPGAGRLSGPAGRRLPGVPAADGSSDAGGPDAAGVRAAAAVRASAGAASDAVGAARPSGSPGAPAQVS